MSKRQIPSSQRPEPQPFSCGLSTRAWASGRVAGPSPAAGRTPCCGPRPARTRLEGPGVGRWLRRGRGAGPPGPAPGRLPGTMAPRSPLPSRPAACTPTAARASWGNATPRPCHRHFTRGTGAVPARSSSIGPLLNLPAVSRASSGASPRPRSPGRASGHTRRGRSSRSPSSQTGPSRRRPGARRPTPATRRVRHLGVQDLPGHGDGMAAVAQAGRIQRQGRAGQLPAREDPGQQGGETGGDLELVAPLGRLGGGRLVELLERKPPMW